MQVVIIIVIGYQPRCQVTNLRKKGFELHNLTQSSLLEGGGRGVSCAKQSVKHPSPFIQWKESPLIE